MPLFSSYFSSPRSIDNIWLLRKSTRDVQFLAAFSPDLQIWQHASRGRIPRMPYFGRMLGGGEDLFLPTSLLKHFPSASTSSCPFPAKYITRTAMEGTACSCKLCWHVGDEDDRPGRLLRTMTSRTPRLVTAKCSLPVGTVGMQYGFASRHLTPTEPLRSHTGCSCRNVGSGISQFCTRCCSNASDADIRRTSGTTESPWSAEPMDLDDRDEVLCQQAAHFRFCGKDNNPVMLWSAERIL